MFKQMVSSKAHVLWAALWFLTWCKPTCLGNKGRGGIKPRCRNCNNFANASGFVSVSPKGKVFSWQLIDSSLVASFGASTFRSAKAVAVFSVDIETDWARGLWSSRGLNMLQLLHSQKIHDCTGHDEDFAVTVCFGKDDSTLLKPPHACKKSSERVWVCGPYVRGDGKSFHHAFES